MTTAVTLIFCFPVSFFFFFWRCSPDRLVLVPQNILYRAANNPVPLFSLRHVHTWKKEDEPFLSKLRINSVNFRATQFTGKAPPPRYGFNNAQRQLNIHLQLFSAYLLSGGEAACIFKQHSEKLLQSTGADQMTSYQNIFPFVIMAEKHMRMSVRRGSGLICW